MPENRLVCSHPVFLASIERRLVHGQIEGARQGNRTVRTELAERVLSHAIDAALAAYRAEGRRLVSTERAVDLVLRALHSESFTPKTPRPTSPAGPVAPGLVLVANSRRKTKTG